MSGNKCGRLTEGGAWKWLLGAAVAGVVLYEVVASPFLHHTAPSSPATLSRSNSFRSTPPLLARTSPCSVTDPCLIKIVADLDKKSHMVEEKKLSFRSLLLTGRLYQQDEGYRVDWDAEPQTLIGQYNEAGRGMELSELINYNSALLTFDDRTGIAYQIYPDARVVPRHVLMEGDGSNPKGMKVEWATEKDGLLYVGSFGKEYTTPEGTGIVNRNNFWIATVDKSGHVEYRNWESVYGSVRSALGVSFPGYAIHEAVNWSPILKQWVFLPRRVSTDPYTEESDEKKGSNKIVLANEAFSRVEVREVGGLTPERGFSSFKFVPGTSDQVLVALKSEENEALGTQGTFITVLGLNGEVLLPEIAVPLPHKFEGLEIVA